MSYQLAPLTKLIEQFSKIPGVGRKSAQRMAYYVMDLDETQAKEFSEAILSANQNIHRCKNCSNFCEKELCPICESATRDQSVICVVEDVRDVSAFERTREYRGLYHVLHGVISPINGVGPDDLTIKELLSRMGDGVVKEVILATNPTVEGEATAMYISRLLKPMGITTSRLAYGIPVGADLEYADVETLYRAIEGRKII